MRAHAFTGTLTVISVCFALSAPAADGDSVAEYSAEYEVRHNGNRVALAHFSVSAESAGGYVFGSVTEARGLLPRLAAPRPITERSRFTVAAGQLRPAAFSYEDGSRKGDDNYSIAFDAAAGSVRISSQAGNQTLTYEADLLDRGSLQVALMQGLAACRVPGAIRYVDDDGIRTYDYQRLEDRDTATGLGTVATVRLSQQRAGSSRRTIIWFARDYGYVPVRIEQFRDGEVDTEFTLASLTGIERSESACSGFG
jgi:hypothetical protein